MTLNSGLRIELTSNLLLMMLSAQDLSAIPASTILLSFWIICAALTMEAITMPRVERPDPSWELNTA